MKKTVLTLLLITSSLFAEVHWFNNLEDAYDVAEKEHKIIFVVLSQEECSSCMYMNNVVLKDAKVMEYLKKNYISVHLDIHHDDVPLALEHFVTPTLYYLNSDEKILYRKNGYENVKELLDDLDSINMQED